ncbi:MAG: SRPBCC domain-containing protein [Polyangiales bacterium]
MIDTELFDAKGRVGDAIDKVVDVAASPREVFDAWTTSEGLRAWMGIPSTLELRVGGAYEWLFLDDAPVGLRGSEGCQVLAYLPDEMLAFSWNAPPSIPYARTRRAWVVVTFAPSPVGARLRLRHLGFGTAGDWPDVRPYFDRAWDSVLARLAAHYAQRMRARSAA